MENIEISNNESVNTYSVESQNETQEELNSTKVETVENKPEENSVSENPISENLDESTQKPPIPEETKTETPEVNSTPNIPTIDDTPKPDNTVNETTQSNQEPSLNTAENTTAPQKTPELTTRKSSRNLSKEERLKRQRELRKKRILESSHERLSRITKTYSQGSSYYDSEKDDSSLSRKSSSRSIHHHGIERTSSRTSINSTTQVQETDNSQLINEPENINNNNNLSRNNSINSINSINNNNNETINRSNSGIYDAEVIQREAEAPTDNSSINTEANSNANNAETNDFARMLFREMLKEEFNKSNNNGHTYGQPAGATPINNIHDIKNNMDTLLTSDKPFEALGKMFDFLNVDEKTTEEQKIAEEKYKQYCSVSKFVHTLVIYIYSMIVVYVSLVAVNVDTEVFSPDKRSGFSSIGYFFYRLANMDTLSHGKSIFGMTPWNCLVLLEITLLAGQIGYQYAFNIKKETFKQLDLLPIPILNKIISLVNQYKLYIEILVNDLFLYLFLIGISVSIGKIFY